MNICLYCGSAFGRSEVYADRAAALSAYLASQGVGIVYGGAHVGLMGVIADAALAAGGKVYGVIPRSLMDRELAHTGLTELHLVETMHQRKAKMAELADAFLALPGGAGTLEELFEVWTMTQLGYQDKAVGLFNVAGFWDGMLDFLRHVVREGFVSSAYVDSLILTEDPAEALEQIRAFQRPPVKWSPSPPRSDHEDGK